MGPKRRPTARHASLQAVRAEADRQLEELAKDAWQWAEQISEPTRLVSRGGVTQRVLGVEEDAKSVRNLHDQ